MAKLTDRAFDHAVVRLRDGQSALDALHEHREELASQMLARLAGSEAKIIALSATHDLLRVRHDGS